MSDYLAIIYIGGGSSHGRSSDKEKAITGALKALRDWEMLFQVSEIYVVVNVIDVEGYGHVNWTGHGLKGRNEVTGKTEKIDRTPEYVTRLTPRFRRHNERRTDA